MTRFPSSPRLFAALVVFLAPACENLAEPAPADVALTLGQDPAWSPDGTRIAFARNRDLGPLEIFVIQIK